MGHRCVRLYVRLFLLYENEFINNPKATVEFIKKCIIAQPKGCVETIVSDLSNYQEMNLLSMLTSDLDIFPFCSQNQYHFFP